MIKLFGRWDTSQVIVSDMALKEYVTVTPMIVPRTQGRHMYQQFYKSRCHIIERLMNRLMVPGHKGKKHMLSSGHCGGKAFTAYKIMKETLSVIEKKMNLNPVQVVVTAVENSAPREEITTIEYGGARYPQAVDCSPQRRVDVVLRMMVQGAYQRSFGKKVSMHDALADEIMRAYQLDQKSVAIAKKLELERQADAAR